MEVMFDKDGKCSQKVPTTSTHQHKTKGSALCDKNKIIELRLPAELLKSRYAELQSRLYRIHFSYLYVM